jgi:hypothetical protein
MAGALAAGGRLGDGYLYLRICVFEFVFLCICICPSLARQRALPDVLDAELPPVVLAAFQEQEEEQVQLQKPWT